MNNPKAPQNPQSETAVIEETPPAVSNAAEAAPRVALPPATGSLPRIADSGRIRFGAGFRLRASK